MIPLNPIRSWKAAFFALPPLLLLLAAAGAPHRGTPAKMPSQAGVSAPPPVQAALTEPPPPEQALSDPLPAVSSLPDPPRQNDPWTPPTTTLPPEFVAATKTLFRQGLADPRGGEYREITVQAGNFIPGMTVPARVHGWLLPRSAFAVCWNGQIYPVTSVGAPADLKADVAAMTPPVLMLGNNPQAENETISQATSSPLKACLLLRLGETALAEHVWAAQSPFLRDGDPYLRLASEWTWGVFNRALDARLQSRDPLALSLLRRLARARSRIEGDAAERHLPRPGDQGYGPPPSSRSYLEFLDCLPELLADQEKRARAPNHTPALLAGEKAFPSKSAYIAALIGDLDEVNPGGSSGVLPTMTEDPIVRALVDQGDAAVEPLIHAIAEDPRLTRAVVIYSFEHKVYPAYAARAAFAAVVIILHTSAFGDGAYRDEDPGRTAAAIQNYWDKYKTLPLVERWYRTLADDQATPPQWQEAADAIVRPTNVTYLGNGEITWQPQPGVVFPMHGESLRGGSTPSVSELMARRVSQIAAAGTPGPGVEALPAHNACAMALDLARWDPQAAIPALRVQTARLDLLEKKGGSSDPWGAEDREEMTVARARGHDTAALTSYVGWLATQDPAAGYPYRLFEPLWRYPHDPAVIAGAARLFDGPPSPWHPLVQKRQNYSEFGDVLHSSLLGLEAFRRSFLSALHDPSPLGTLRVGAQGWQGRVEVPGIGSTRPNDAVVDPFRPKVSQTLTIRRCDLYAWHLSHLAGMPRFQFYWPQSKRDAVIAEAASRLRRYGACFEYQENLDPLWDAESRPKYAPGLAYLWDAYSSPLAHLSFLHLDHPATPAEAAHGKAIFSLAGQGERRLWPLPHWPLPARWVTDRRYPQAGTLYNGKPTVEYQQDGLVWQAEEVQQNGRWRRFYGFVGEHDIARVPAEQIEFPPDHPYEWQSFSSALDAKVSLPKDSHRLPVGRPLPVTLTLRCRSSQDRNIPTEWLRMGADGPALREGLTLHLSYSPGPSFPGLGSPEAEARRVWMPLTPIRTASFAPSSAVQRLAPTQETTALRLNLRDWYTLNQPGSYRLLLEFDGRRSGLGEGSVPQLWFELTK